MESIIGRLKFPKSSEVAALYLQCDEAVSIEYQQENRKIILRQGERLSSSSYFNSFYERYYTKYTSIASIQYSLMLEGDFAVGIYRELGQGRDRENVFEGNFESCQLSSPTHLPLIELLQEDKAGRLYIELVCLSETGVFQGGLITTNDAKPREIALGIVICTYKKEEYVKNTLSAILQDSLLQDKDFKVFIVDNGRTLDSKDFNDPRIQLIPNKNAGGSGGFTRGLIEALNDESRSHFLVMDDDIELESESIYRLFAIHEYAKSSFVIAGGLISLLEKHILHEAGATHNGSPQARGKSGSLTALNHRLDLRDARSLNQLLIEEEADYGGFWFCSFSRSIVESIKLPLPLFIKLDDVEFCMRAKRALEIPIVSFPSLAVWHMAASDKDLDWETYYYFRNDFITYAVHFLPDYDHTVSNLTQEITTALSKAKYDRAHVLIRAFSDYLKGPNLILDSEPDILHLDILKFSRTYENQGQDVEALSNELLAKWSDVAEQGRQDWAAIAAAWRDAAGEMTSTVFWQQYLGVCEREEAITAVS